MAPSAIPLFSNAELDLQSQQQQQQQQEKLQQKSKCLCLKFHDDQQMNPFESLVDEIKKALGTSSGIDSADVDVQDLVAIMERYQSNEIHWGGFAHEDLSRNYTRNFVDHGNGKANLLILVWTPGKGSLVHDHADAHCIMKILKGTLQETLYEMPSETAVDQPLKVEKVSTFGTNEVAYISDDIGLHCVSNPDPKNIAVSLHLYTPPWAARRGCYCFCAETGKKHLVQMCNYYSVHGKVNRGCDS